MGREHFTMSIDVDSFSLCLFKQKLQILQIMTGYYNKRSFFYSKCNSSWFRCSIGFCICFIKKCHTLQIDFPYLQYGRKQRLHAFFIADLKECFAEELIHFGIFVVQNICMIGIGCHSANPEKNKRLQRTDIFIGIPQLLHIVFVCSAAG